MSLILPYSFTAATKAKASEVNANFSAIASKFTEGVGGIANGDIAVAAGIIGSKISNVAGQRIPTDRIEDLNITTGKLQNSTGTLDGVTTAKIADRAVTAAKIGTNVILSGNLKYTKHSQSFSVAVPGGGGLASLLVAGIELTPSGTGAPGNISTHIPLGWTLTNVTGTASLSEFPDATIKVDGSGNVRYIVQGKTRNSAGYTLGGFFEYYYLAVS